jgi:hypothetical protein
LSGRKDSTEGKRISWIAMRSGAVDVLLDPRSARLIAGLKRTAVTDVLRHGHVAPG